MFKKILSIAFLITMLSVNTIAEETTKNYTKGELSKHGNTDEKLWRLIVRSKYDEAKKYIKDKNIDIDMGTNDGTTLLMYAAKGSRVKHVEFLLDVGAKINLLGDNGTALNEVCGGYIARGDNYTKSLEIVKLLIEKGADLNLMNKYGMNPAIAAATGNKSEVMQLLVDAGADINVKKPDTLDTPLIIASEKNHIDTLKVLLKSNIVMNKKNSNQEDALDVAIKNNHIKIAKLLIDAGLKDSLMYAISQQRVQIVKYLLANGANLDKRDEKYQTPLMVAANNSDIKTVKTLIDSKASLDLSSSDGKNALMISILSDHENSKKVSTLLIESGINLNLVDEEGNSALMYCANKKDIDTAKLLIKKGAKTNIVNLDNKTTYEYAMRKYSKIAELIKPTLKQYEASKNQDLIYAAKKGNKRKLKKLLKKDYELNCIDKDGKTALIYALEKKKYSAALKMINKGADVNIVDSHGKTALFYACESRIVDLVSAIVEKGAKVNVIDNSSREPLMFVKDTKSLEFLLKSGADVNAKNGAGWTLLMIAASNGKNDIVKFLLSHNADKTIKSNSDKTALDIAKENGRGSTADLLL